MRKIDWEAVDRSLLVPEQIRQHGRLRTIYKFRKHLRLYKVHGSLNYFHHREGVVENNAWMWDPPEFAPRVMITPGLSKFEKLQRYRVELLGSADNAINKASQFLFLGYGFNDKHLEEYIKRKLTTQGCKGLVITRDYSTRLEALLNAAPNLWAVCRSDESGSDGTRIFNKQYAGWLKLPTEKIWDVREFSKSVFGD